VQSYTKDEASQRTERSTCAWLAWPFNFAKCLFDVLNRLRDATLQPKNDEIFKSSWQAGG